MSMRNALVPGRDTAAKWLRMLDFFSCEFACSVRMDAGGGERNIYSSEF